MSLIVGKSIEHQNTEVHPLGETPKVTKESTEPWETKSRLQSDTSLNDTAHEKPIEKSVWKKLAYKKQFNTRLRRRIL